MDHRRIAYLHKLAGLAGTPAEKERLARDLNAMAGVVAHLPEVPGSLPEKGSPLTLTAPGPQPLSFTAELVARNAPRRLEGFFAVDPVDTWADHDAEDLPGAVP